MTGEGYGIMKAILACKKIRYEVVNPSVWMKEVFKGNNTNDKKAEETIKKIKQKGAKAVLLKGDISKPKDAESIVKTFVAETNNVDILVNNAGIYERSNVEEISLERWNQVIKPNLTGSFYLCKKALPHMEPGSKIIFVSSQLAFRGSSHGADYASSKAGMLGLMRSLALELASKKINVNAVAPGTIDTDIIANYSEEVRKQRIMEIPLNRLGTSKDIANTCLFLASNLSDYITGETIHVNGGLYIH